MSFKADAKAFQGKGFSHFVVRNGCAVSGFTSEDSAGQDANDRNARAKKLGVEQDYKVESVADCSFSQDRK